jgi:transcriptional regulator with XRE-family HTH domain
MEHPRDFRISKGLTQQQLAQIANVSLATVVRGEKRGEWPISPLVRNRLRRALGLDQPAAATVADQADGQFGRG